MKKDKFTAYILVAIQMISIILILATGRPLASGIPLLVIEIAGILLGLWAIVIMGRTTNINIAPLVKQSARLVTNGPYALIRHPMYSSVLLTIWPLIIDQYSLLRLMIGLILTVDLIVKLLFEENRLREHFAGYEIYRRQTKMLIPFVL
ncbi:MAG: methyltransferase family protein [Syntrophales bacterium]